MVLSNTFRRLREWLHQSFRLERASGGRPRGELLARGGGEAPATSGRGYEDSWGGGWAALTRGRRTMGGKWAMENIVREVTGRTQAIDRGVRDTRDTIRSETGQTTIHKAHRRITEESKSKK